MKETAERKLADRAAESAALSSRRGKPFMANPLAEAAVEAVELESFAKGIPDYVYKSRTKR